jgi:hypothetical protein
MGRATVLLAGLILGTAACQKAGTKGGAGAAASSTAGGSATTLALTDGESQVTIELLTPASSYMTPMPEIRWTPVDGAASYDLALDDTEGCPAPLQTFHTGNSARTTQVAGFLANGVYFACITARNAEGAPLATGTGNFWVLATGVADPAVQNGVGGSGAALKTPDLTAFPLFQDDWTSKGLRPARQGDSAAPYSFGAYADPRAGSTLAFVVNDRGNHRVLVFRGVPTRPDALPSVVVGQPDFNSSHANGANGAGVGNSGFLDNVHASLCTSGELLVTDRGNNRLLIWRQVPSTNGEPAEIVVGQADFAGAAPGAGADHLNQPSAAYCLGGKLLVLDRGNHRVLVYNKLPSHNGAAADYVIGQQDFRGNSPDCAANRMNGPAEALFADGHLWIADGGNHRVLGFAGIPSKTGAAATQVLGQADLTSCQPNRGGAAGSDTLNAPSSLASRPGFLAVADGANQRVLLYTTPVAMGAEAAYVIGQPDATTTRRTSPPEMGSLDLPKGLLFDGNYLWVGDSGNRRIAVLPLPF